MEQQLLSEIRDLLKEQNRLIAELKAQNETALSRQAEHIGKAEDLAQRSFAQNTVALASTKSVKIGFWVFLAALLLLFAVPSILSAYWR